MTLPSIERTNAETGNVWRNWYRPTLGGASDFYLLDEWTSKEAALWNARSFGAAKYLGAFCEGTKPESIK